MKLPYATGHSLSFAALQEGKQGVNRWIEIPAAFLHQVRRAPLEDRCHLALKFRMDRKQLFTAGHAVSIAAALFAITLNFLQPLVHAAVIRGGPATVAVWKSLCLPAGQDDDAHPSASEPHACCLGLAHAPSLPVPWASFITIRTSKVLTSCPDVEIAALGPVGIRDGPTQPHGPPLLS